MEVRGQATVPLTEDELAAILVWIDKYNEHSVHLINKIITFKTNIINETYKLSRYDMNKVCTKSTEEAAKLWIWLAVSLSRGRTSTGFYEKITKNLLHNNMASEASNKQLEEALSRI